jgi:putative tryptophan/tyrosine transport system substrate-binding protein
MRRRELIALISGVMTAFALPVYAQQPSTSRRVGVLMNLSETDPEAQRLITTFRESLNKMGWVEGANLHIDYRWSAGDIERIRKYAAELIALGPEVILAYGGSVVGPLLKLSRSLPIVFTEVVDPIAAGFIVSLARPGGNVTGFSLIDFGISRELLKQIAPSITKVVVFEQPSSPGAAGQVLGSNLVRCGDHVRAERARRDRTSHCRGARSKRRRDCNSEPAFDSQS